MAAAAAAALLWKARFRKRVVDVARCSDRVRELLTSALPHLTSPMPAGDAVAARARIQLVQDKLRDASNNVASVVSFIGAAEILALRGGSTDPVMPLHMIHQLGDQNLAERDALGVLRETRMTAVETYAIVDWCLSHLRAVFLLLEHPGIPDVGVLIEAERLAAVGDLEAAIANAQLCAAEATDVRQDVTSVD
ncbi:hypothetical protein ABZP36_016892 [Zizania latifolia]